MKDLVSPRQVAQALGVSEASLKRWCDRGLLPAVRTAGGHRRLPVNEVVQFARRRGQPLVRPEVLGLPRAGGASEHTLARVARLFRPAIEAGDEEQSQRLLMNLYLAGRSVPEIGDHVIAPTFSEIGERWSHGALQVYAERRGLEVCTRVLHQLRMALPTVDAGSPLAIGATLAGDPYTLPTALAELVLRELGWDARNYGIGHPATTLCAAIDEVRPRLFWLSVSAIPDVDDFVRSCEAIHEATRRVGSALVLGGRALDDRIRQRLGYTAYCDTLAHLAAFAQTLHRVIVTDAAPAGAAP